MMSHFKDPHRQVSNTSASDNLPLPKGWRRTESRKYPGCFYYIRPDGGATWLLEGQTRKDLPKQLQSIYGQDFVCDKALTSKVNPSTRAAREMGLRHSSYQLHPKVDATRDGETFVSLKQRDFIKFPSKRGYRPPPHPSVPPITSLTALAPHNSLYRSTYQPYLIDSNDGSVVSGASGAFALKAGGTEADDVNALRSNANSRLQSRTHNGGACTPRVPTSDASESSSAINTNSKFTVSPRIVYRPSTSPQASIQSSKNAPASMKAGHGRGRGVVMGGAPSSARGAVPKPPPHRMRHNEDEEGDDSITNISNVKRYYSGTPAYRSLGDGGSVAAVPPRPQRSNHNDVSTPTPSPINPNINGIVSQHNMRRPYASRPKDFSAKTAKQPFTDTTNYRAYYVDFKPKRPVIAKPNHQMSFGEWPTEQHSNDVYSGRRGVFGAGGGGGGGSDLATQEGFASSNNSNSEAHPNTVYRDDFKGYQPAIMGLSKQRKAVIHARMKGIPSHYVSHNSLEFGRVVAVEAEDAARAEEGGYDDPHDDYYHCDDLMVNGVANGVGTVEGDDDDDADEHTAKPTPNSAYNAGKIRRTNYHGNNSHSQLNQYQYQQRSPSANRPLTCRYFTNHPHYSHEGVSPQRPHTASFRDRMRSIDQEVVRRLKETNSLGDGY